MADISTVVSLVPFDIREEKPGLYPGRFYIPASKDNTPSILFVHTGLHFVYLDETRGSVRVKDLSGDIANSIVKDYLSSQLGSDDNARPGLFWLPEEVSLLTLTSKHKDLLEENKRVQKNWFINCCKIADNDWQRYHQHNVISHTQRIMADLIGWRPEEHEWMSPLTTLKTTPCPACGLQTTAAICPNCRCVLDKERVKDLTFA
jgi:hypothetical protein